MSMIDLHAQLLITDAAHHADGIDGELLRIGRALEAGIRLVQLREPPLENAARLAFAQAVQQRCRAVGAALLISERGDGQGIALARTLGADGVNLTAQALRTTRARPDFPLVGASCHGAPELQHAARLFLDYALLGHVLPTPSHPDQPPLGWARFAELARACPLPVYALGGQSPATLAIAQQNGACGIAGIRLGLA
jgi:8-oxo-dGTP diphosphatase